MDDLDDIHVIFSNPFVLKSYLTTGVQNYYQYQLFCIYILSCFLSSVIVSFAFDTYCLLVIYLDCVQGV